MDGFDGQTKLSTDVEPIIQFQHQTTTLPNTIIQAPEELKKAHKGLDNR